MYKSGSSVVIRCDRYDSLHGAIPRTSRYWRRGRHETNDLPILLIILLDLPTETGTTIESRMMIGAGESFVGWWQVLSDVAESCR
ncbi:MAG: hypothetical protein KDA99_09770 [Planctomycetales bacterium]|nr:hypothetical protein [Planctomycetales bacterium]